MKTEELKKGIEEVEFIEKLFKMLEERLKILEKNVKFLKGKNERS